MLQIAIILAKLDAIVLALAESSDDGERALEYAIVKAKLIEAIRDLWEE